MSWSNSTRRQRLPADWNTIRRKVLKRDGYMCQQELPDKTLCLDSATDVDHIRRGDDHSLSNLRAMCRMHHARKSAGEGGQAMQAKRRQNAKKLKRVEGHPGLL